MVASGSFSRLARGAAFVLLLLLAAPASVPAVDAAGNSLRLGGTGSGSALLQALAQDYAALRPELAIEVVNPPLGSLGGLRALAAGRIELAALARLPDSKEERPGLAVTPWARTPLVLATSTGTREAGFTAASLAEVLRGVLKQWDSGAKIQLVLRLPTESDIRSLAALSPELKAALDQALRDPASVKADTDLDAIELLRRTQGSLGPTTLGLIKLTGVSLRVLPFNGVRPSLTAMASGEYALSKTLYLAHDQALSEAGRAFLDWLRSPEARDRLIDLEHHPLFP